MRALSIGFTMSLANYTTGNSPARAHSRGPDVFWNSGNKPHVRSRAYVKFKSPEYLVAFSNAFDGHTFTDSKGTPISPREEQS
jgi:hypothetical protein